MKKVHWKSFLAGVLVAVLVLALAIPVLGAEGSFQTWKDVLVGGITIVLNGKTLQPTDANGNPVDPVIYNGTTYLPVRAIASALGLPVDWDGATRTVYLGEKPASGYVWVLTDTDITLEHSDAYPDTYIYSYGGNENGKEWLIFNYRWSNGEEYTNADCYFGCDAPPAAIPSGGKIDMEMDIRVKNFAGYERDGTWSVAIGSSYVTAGYGTGSRLRNEGGDGYLYGNNEYSIVVAGNMEKHLTVSDTVPKSEKVGDEMKITYHCDAGIFTWYYTLQYR